MRRLIFAVATVGAFFPARHADAQELSLDVFDRIELTDAYFSEGVGVGDIDGDGAADVVYGPYWFKGPDFKVKQEISPAQPQNRKGYADSFFAWVYDFNADGANDVLCVGFPGTPACVYENPGSGALDQLWEKHEVFDWVSNESPQFTNLVGDERPELVCTREGQFGYVSVDWETPFAGWTFHAISVRNAPERFGHGLGVGDVNADGHLDVLMKDGWFQQPAPTVASAAGEIIENASDQWAFHAVPFAPRGGADMFAYDVDGDGDNDVITSLAAHEFGLAWWEQVPPPKTDLAISTRSEWRQHLIMGSKPEENKYGVVFSELHSVALADVDGDGLQDIVTGKTYYSHHEQSPMWDAGAVVYWFKLVRGVADGAEAGAGGNQSSAGNRVSVDWVPYKVDGDSGIGRQVTVSDVNGDGLPDIVAGGMKGANVLLHRKDGVSQSQRDAVQPREYRPIAAGLTPEQAAAAMTVPAGFHVTLGAGEPQVHQPIAFTIDERGRLWVAEAYTYPIRAAEGAGLDKIIILEDTDQDGSLDSRKVFAEGLNLVSGLEVGFGGVWVGAAPYLLFIPDRDGDDVPDESPLSRVQSPGDGAPASTLNPQLSTLNSTILLDGFGYEDTHETLNALIWGPDGWLYGCHGVFTHSLVGKPGTPDNQRTPMNAAVWRYHPTRHEFEVFAEGTSNPWGVDFNDTGDAFITACVIPHLYHVFPGGRYQRQAGQHFNPHTYADIQTIARHRHYAGDIREHAWWGGREPTAPQSTLDAGGGHAHAGAMIYLGDNWPASYRNQIFMHNIHGNRINEDLLMPEGSGYAGDRAPDLLLAHDQWFRGINLKYGPDGTVWLIDWYDKNACHRRTPEIWDRTNGRIYNVAYGDAQRQSVDLRRLPDLELARLQMHENDWFVRTSRRLLQERAAAGHVAQEAVEYLRRLLFSKSDVTRRLRAFWSLHAIDGVPGGDWTRLMEDEQEQIRKWAIRLAVDRPEVPSGLAARLTRRDDPSPVVRLAIASAMPKLPVESQWTIARQLVGHAEDADDHNLPLMDWYAIERLMGTDPQRALELARTSEIPLVSRFIVRRAAEEPEAHNALFAFIADDIPAADREGYLDEVLTGFEGRVNIAMPRAWQHAYDVLSGSESEAVRDRADRIAVLLGDRRVFPKLRWVVLDADAPIERRRAALDTLVRGQDAQAVAVLQTAVELPQLRGAAIRALSAYDDPQTPQVLLSRYAKLSAAEQADVVSTLTARPEYAHALLQAIAEGQVPRTDLHAYHVQQMLRFDDEALQQRIGDVWGAIRETSADKQMQIANFKRSLSPRVLKAAEPSAGRAVFAKTCAACHTLFGEGGQVGPDLTGSNRGDLDYILQNVVDPSAVLGKDYRQTVIVMNDGRVVSGLVQKETDSALTVRTINDTLVVPRADIEERALSDQSMMPERLLEPLLAEQVRDLIAYLGSPTQVPLKGPPAPIDTSTGTVPGAIEGESLKVLRKTGGSARAQPMSNFPDDRWSGNSQLWWTGAKPDDRLDVELPVVAEGSYSVEIVLTRARDYGIAQLSLDEQPLGGPIDLFNAPEVITTGVLGFPAQHLSKGSHTLSVEIAGANPQAVKAYMVGVDYVRLTPAE